jgi:hypothetical protein
MMSVLDPRTNEEGKARLNDEEALSDLLDPSTVVSLYSDDLVLPHSIYFVVPDFLNLLFIDSADWVLSDNELFFRRVNDTFVRVTFVVIEVLAEPLTSPLDESSVGVALFTK